VGNAEKKMGYIWDLEKGTQDFLNGIMAADAIKKTLKEGGANEELIDAFFNGITRNKQNKEDAAAFAKLGCLSTIVIGIAITLLLVFSQKGNKPKDKHRATNNKSTKS